MLEGELREKVPIWFCITLFLARLLDALLTSVQRTLLALGRLHHILLGLGVYDISCQEYYAISLFRRNMRN